MSFTFEFMFHEIKGLWFFTSTINSWNHLLKDNDLKSIILNSWEFLVSNKRINIHGFVIMPNHIHLLLTTDNLTSFQKDFLSFTSHQIVKDLRTKKSNEILNQFHSTQNDRQYQIWERRARSIPVRTVEIFQQKLTYIHNNPLQPKWELAENAEKYEWSSASFYAGGKNEFKFLSSLDI